MGFANLEVPKQDNGIEVIKPELHPEAVQDFYDQLCYLEEKHCNDQTLMKFVRTIREGREKIGQNPLTWNFANRSNNVRKLPTRLFRFVIFYVVPPNGVPLILDSAGPGRQPRWAKRL